MGRRWNRFWSRKVAAGIYVGTALAVAFFISPPEFLDRYPWLRVVGWVVVAGCVFGAVYEWFFRKDELLAAPEPDTILEVDAVRVGGPRIDEPELSLIFSMPNQFALRNYGGNATDVTIAPVVIGAYRDLGEEGNQAERTVQFPIIDVDHGETRPILPSFTWLGTQFEEWTMATFFNALIKRRRNDGAPPFGVKFPHDTIKDGMQGEIQEFSDLVWHLQNDPLDIELKVSCSSRSTRRRWETIETLHYNPRIGIAHVKHGTPKEVNEYGQELPLLPNLEPQLPLTCPAYSRAGDPAIHLGRGSPDDDNYTAVILPLRNDPPSGGRAGDAISVKAVIRAGRERVVTAYWLDSDGPEVDIKSGESARELVLVFVDANQDVWMLDDSRPRDAIIQHLLYEAKTRGPRYVAGMSVELVMDGRTLGNFQYEFCLHPTPHARIPRIEPITPA